MKLKKLMGTLLAGAMIISSLPAAVSASSARPDTVMAPAVFYDYEKSPENQLGEEYFLFGRETGNYGTYNSWTKENDWLISRGLVEDELNEKGKPELAEKRVKVGKKYQEKQLIAAGTKSGKLFEEEERVPGTYQIPFVYNKDTNRYEYDSAKYRMLINKKNQTVECSEYPAGMTPRFLPLDKDKENYYFGMTVSLPFVYANGGSVGGDDMVFEFSGDDDIWVFVDGKLTLDLGGIHNAVSGSINFKTGEVKTVGKINKWDADDKVTAAKLEGFDKTNKNHEIKIFYLERGAGESNFKLAYNLIQPTNYIIKYYDGKTYNGRNGNEGLIETIIQYSHDDGTLLYLGDVITQDEIRININKTTADILASDDYYGGFVVDENFIAVTDPNAAVTTVTDDDTDVVNVIFIPKPSYTVTYWNEDENGQRTQITQKIFRGKAGDTVKTDDIVTDIVFENVEYKGGKIVTSDDNGVLGTLNANTPFNVDVVFSAEKDPQPDQASDYAYIFGRTDTRMEANDNMRRGEASAVLYRLLKQRGNTGDFEYDKNTRPAFADLAGRWDRSSLEYMAHIGVYNKTPGQNICPDEPVTRGEAFKLFALALGMTGETKLSPDQYAQILVDRGYVSGYEDGSLKLENNITRAEYCTIYNFIIRRDKFGLELAGGTPVTAQTYGFEDLQPSDWYYETMLKATSAYNKDGFVSLELRNERNWLDDYE